MLHNFGNSVTSQKIRVLSNGNFAILGQLIKTDWKAVDWIQLLQVRSPIRYGKTVMDIGTKNGRTQLRMHWLVTWFKVRSLDCGLYTTHVSATYREMRNILVRDTSVTLQHMRVSLRLPSVRLSRSLFSQTLRAVHDQSTRL